jgi:hypothetical protein
VIRSQQFLFPSDDSGKQEFGFFQP